MNIFRKEGRERDGEREREKEENKRTDESWGRERKRALTVRGSVKIWRKTYLKRIIDWLVNRRISHDYDHPGPLEVLQDCSDALGNLL